MPTFADRAELFILNNQHLAKSTLIKYLSVLNCYWMPTLADYPINEIIESDIKQIFSRNTHLSGKTLNNSLSIIRQVFQSAYYDGILDKDPTARIKSFKHQKPLPNPLKLKEVYIILNWLKQNKKDWHNYFRLAFFTGLRTSELIGLQWKDFNFNRELLRIQRAKVQDDIKITKTANIREVELNSEALKSLLSQKQQTNTSNSWVFLNPNTSKVISNDKPPRLIWNKAIKATGIKPRNAYQTRHTFATLNLMVGAVPLWVSHQMGHSSLLITLGVYARWIDRADMGKEKAKINKILSLK